MLRFRTSATAAFCKGTPGSQWLAEGTMGPWGRGEQVEGGRTSEQVEANTLASIAGGLADAHCRT